MPYLSAHAARIVSPSAFQKGTMRTKKITDGITIIIGKRKGEKSMSTQAYRFDKSKFTAEQARKWLKDHDVKPISFEKAKENMEELEEVSKTVAGKSYPASDFLVVEDPKQPSKWHLQVKKNGKPDHTLMGAAWASLHKGYRGNKYEGPDKAKAITALKALYKSEEMPVPMEEADIAECGGMEAEYVPWGITSFADLEAFRATQETVNEMRDLFSDLQRLAENIMGSMTIEDKKTALVSLMADFVSILTGETIEPEPEEMMSSELAEAATLKSHAKAAIKALEGLLGEKKLPKKLLGQITEMKNALNKTWKDLGDEADNEPVEDEEACKGGKDKKKKMKEDGSEPLAETFAGVMGIEVLQEADSSLLEMDVQIIRPGWGNKRDGHYYPAEMLKSSAEKFIGAKMYETDHKAQEKNTRTWVSTIKEIKGFTDDGAPIAKVAVHDPNFAERVRNLKEAGLLEKMECSILADGTAKAGSVDGRKGKIVESITEVSSVDWVTKAGAGGHALALSESDGGREMADNLNEQEAQTPAPETTPVAESAPAQPAEPTRLSEVQVKEVLEKSTLPEASKERLAEGEFATEVALQEAITKEVAYVKKITGSGKPFGMGDTSAPAKPTVMTEAEREAEFQKIRVKHGLA